MNRKCAVAVLIMLCVLGGAFLFYSEAKRKRDLTNTMHNLRFVYSRIEEYKEIHGKYPASQNVKTLFEELGIMDRDFFRVDSVDIGSALYYAPANNSEEPILTIQVRPHIIGKNCRIVMRKNGACYENMGMTRQDAP